ncbi:protein translocase subunit SecD [Kineosporia sp. NBRC 101731]|uniref:protein translocase subunit SecD n=1 Tax=Kineosporia sp. NBRC 101731 TaxID=3032199 RepID=UPI0024A5D35C|nr:protein translocase subunit SecD [Kineosporia sp. NBRC 101731]GLY32782.1 protein translocase subunit SecDF [Kineosporia sp. NBRC 101731]
MRAVPVVRAVLALAVIATSLFVALTMSPRLGLDLRGGTQIVLQGKSTETVEANADATDRALSVLRNRIDALGVTDPSVTRSGENRIIIELPGVQDPREAAEVVGRTAQLTFHPVVSAEPAPAEGKDEKLAKGQQRLVDEDGQPLVVGASVMTGEGVGDAAGLNDPSRGPGWFVTIDFKDAGGDAWRQLTADAACAVAGDPQRRIAIVLDDEVISSPQVDPSIACNVGMTGSSTEITGQFSAEQAQDLAVLIKGGALPIPVEVIEQRTVGPTLGADAIDASIKAAIVGLILTGLFITLVYRVVGFLATLALACYALISYAFLVMLGATLTLPGLAGFVLAIGMAIDANVLVFERAREEFGALPPGKRQGQGALTNALKTGFDKAWTAIIDTNVTTLLAAALLFFLATGPVRGFGVTLSIGVIASMVSALIIARVFTEWAVRRQMLRRRPGLSGLAGNGRLRQWLETSGPDLMGRGRIWLGVSLAIVVVSVAGILVRGLNLGVEFTGGRLLTFSTSQAVTADQAREVVGEAGFPRAVVQTSSPTGGAAETISVRTEELTNDEALSIQEALGAIGGEVSKETDELIGPSLGDELRTKALIALGAAILAQMIYLAIRFRWTFGISAALTMFHDVLAVVGIFAWLGKPIDGVFLAAALTVIGLSVNDTVVVFDRVRELRRSQPGEPFGRVVNSAILQTVPRTINTGLGAMFILAALTVLGGDSLTDFALALLIGLVVGTLSSVFTASPLAIVLERFWPDESEPEPEPGPDDNRSGPRPVTRTSIDPYAHIPSGRTDGGQ